MRVVATHDTAGNIGSLLASPADARRAGVTLESCQYVHEVEVPDLALDADDAQIHARLNEVIEFFQVAQGFAEWHHGGGERRAQERKHAHST